MSSAETTIPWRLRRAYARFQLLSNNNSPSTSTDIFVSADDNISASSWPKQIPLQNFSLLLPLEPKPKKVMSKWLQKKIKYKT